MNIYLLLFLEFFKIGLFTFGGGYAMIPLVKETVLKYEWLSETQFYDFIGVCESTPGPVAINMATYIGSITGGPLGSIIATLGVVLPSFLIIVIIAAVLNNLTKNKHFKNFLNGVKPVVVGLILSTGFILLIKAVGYNSDSSFDFNIISTIVFVIIASIFYVSKIVFKKKISAVYLIILSAGLGIVFSLIIK